MKVFLQIQILLALVFASTSFACDFDNDGISDPLTYNSSNFVWQYKQSSDSTTVSVNDFGEANSYPIPGHYINSSSATNLAYIDSDDFWNIRISPSQTDAPINYGRIDASYLGGHDFNGDGLADAAKMVNRCTRLKRKCHKNNTRFNILYNNVVGTDAFVDVTALVSGFFGKGLSPLFVMDINADGKDDICYGVPKKNNRKVFRAFCKDVGTFAILKKFNLGRIFNRPLSINVNGQDQVVLWKTRTRQADTQITLVSNNGSKSRFNVPTDGTVVIGDWLGLGSEQVGVATGGVLTILNPLNGAISTMLIPTGDPIDCNNNLYGRAADKYLTSRNVCRVLSCK